MANPILNLSTLNGSNGFRINGVAANDFSGYSVSGAGDINGDGIDDVIVGAFGADSNGSDTGSSYVVFGSRTGFAADLTTWLRSMAAMAFGLMALPPVTFQVTLSEVQAM